jgi:uncharacterized membrane protein (UPF0127 family)
LTGSISARRKWSAVVRAATAPFLVGCSVVVGSVACSSPDAPVFDTRSFDTASFEPVEVVITSVAGVECVVCMWQADDADTRAAGLRGVTAVRDLGGAAGMVFRYSEPVRTKFWMGDVGIGLELHQFDADGSHIGDTAMAPCLPGTDPPDCPRYGVDEAFLVAVEVPAGTGAELGLGPGSSVRTAGPCDPAAQQGPSHDG